MSFYHAAIIYSTKMYYKIHKIYTIFIVIPLALPPLMLPTALLLRIFLKRQNEFLSLKECTFIGDKAYDVKKIYNTVKNVYSGECCLYPLHHLHIGILLAEVFHQHGFDLVTAFALALRVFDSLVCLKKR